MKAGLPILCSFHLAVNNTNKTIKSPNCAHDLAMQERRLQLRNIDKVELIFFDFLFFFSKNDLQ